MSSSFLIPFPLRLPWDIGSDDSARYFPYYITVASFSILYVALLVFLLSRHRLLPAIVMIGAFLVSVLWFVGLVVVSIQLWGSNGVNGECNLRVFDRSPTGDSEETLAWLMEKSICELALVSFFPFSAGRGSEGSVVKG